jgi:hypothetical protein
MIECNLMQKRKNIDSYLKQKCDKGICFRKIPCITMTRIVEILLVFIVAEKLLEAFQWIESSDHIGPHM